MSEFDCLLPLNWKKQIDEWLAEDIPSFDYGGFVVGKQLIHFQFDLQDLRLNLRKQS